MLPSLQARKALPMQKPKTLEQACRNVSKAWAELVIHFEPFFDRTIDHLTTLLSKKPSVTKAFYNTALGEPWTNGDEPVSTVTDAAAGCTSQDDADYDGIASDDSFPLSGGNWSGGPLTLLSKEENRD